MLSEKIAAWAARESTVQALVLIGSRVRAGDDAVWAADTQSDWDYLVISSAPRLFADAAWTRGLGVTPKLYVARVARLGAVPKIAALFAEGAADFVIQPAAKFRLVRAAMVFGLHRRDGALRRRLQELAVVIRPGWRFLKGADQWEPFYRRVVAEVPDARLGDPEARALADGFVFDAVWTQRKIERGEFLAAQRMIHRELAEVNFRLLHERRLRRGVRSFPEARRIERVASASELMAVTVNATPDADALRAAVEKSSATLRESMGALVPDWRWPLL